MTMYTMLRNTPNPTPQEVLPNAKGGPRGQPCHVSSPLQLCARKVLQICRLDHDCSGRQSVPLHWLPCHRDGHDQPDAVWLLPRLWLELPMQGGRPSARACGHERLRQDTPVGRRTGANCPSSAHLKRECSRCQSLSVVVSRCQPLSAVVTYWGYSELNNNWPMMAAVKPWRDDSACPSACRPRQASPEP